MPYFTPCLGIQINKGDLLVNSTHSSRLEQTDTHIMQYMSTPSSVLCNVVWSSIFLPPKPTPIIIINTLTLLYAYIYALNSQHRP